MFNNIGAPSIGAPSSKRPAGFGSNDPKWHVGNLLISKGREECAASIGKKNDVNKIPEHVFEATPNLRKGEHESMAAFYAKKYPHASALFSDPVVQLAALKAYVKNPEAPNTHVNIAMGSVTPCMTPEQQDEIVAQMGFEWDGIVKAEPSRALVLRFLHNTSEASQNHIAKKIADECWGGSEDLLGYVCDNANMFGFERPRAAFVDAICSGKLKFESANAKKRLAQAIYDGHLGDDPKLLAKLTDKLGMLFGANNINERSLNTYLETLNILDQAVRFGRLGQHDQISQTFAAFRLAEIEKLFTPQASPEMKKALVDAICQGKFGDAPEVREILVNNLVLFATNVADLDSVNSFDKHLNALLALAGFVYDQGFGKDRQILSKLAENTKIFIVDLKLFSRANLQWFSDPRVEQIRKQITFSIVSEKFKGTVGAPALEQLEKFRDDNITGYTWDLRAFVSLGLLSAVHTAMDVDEQRDTLAGGKRRHESEDAEAANELKRPRPAIFAGLLAGITAGVSLRKNEGGASSDVAVDDGRPRAPAGLLAGIQAGGMKLRNRTIGNEGQGSNASSSSAAKPGNTPAKPSFLAELQESAKKRAASRVNNPVEPAQTHKEKEETGGLLNGKNSLLGKALKLRRANMGEASPFPSPDGK